MLNLQSKLCKLVFAALVFSMVAFGVLAPAMAMAKEAKAEGSTVDVSAEKASGEKNAADKAGTVVSTGTKSLTIDFFRSGKKAEVAGRKVTIWKISDGLRPEDSGLKDAKSFQDVARLLEGKSEKELNASYSSHKSYDTDAEGKLSLTLERGLYYLRVAEKQGATTIFPFVFVANPGDSNGVIYPKGAEPTSSGVELTKISTDRVPLPGAVFQLFFLDKNNRIPVKNPSGGADFVTDAVGKIVIKDLAPGKYVFVETKAPAGYRIKHPEVPFEITDKKVKKLTVENYKDKEGGKTFKKVSSADNKPLSGAQFLVTKKTEKGYMRMKKNGKDMVLTSGANGTFVANGLPDGDYYLWEIKAPAGYASLSGSVKFTVSADSLKKELIIKNTPQTTPPGKTPPGKTPPGKTTPPGTSTPPGRTTPPYDDKHVNIPKTGDVQLLMMSVSGLLSGLLGVKILKDNE
ncbi:SpaA isopeptide-forming pilin-related protein [Aedoeadaptatus acetigenes]|uniref:SpaA isopeptide-forming pilin-related protein n=1 Tax=Aedoeadaptatus acetigenes TaxID=2981723 RepID=A0ABV1J824_9FIRM